VLRVLSLADNLLADPAVPSTLAALCPRLEALSLEGNPIALVPNYRRVSARVPGVCSHVPSTHVPSVCTRRALRCTALAQPKQQTRISTPHQHSRFKHTPHALFPHRRARVLLAMPGLVSLDGRPVAPGERAAAPAALAAEEAVLALLLRNACEVHKLVSPPAVHTPGNLR
jgi:hypothetical protein